MILPETFGKHPFRLKNARRDNELGLHNESPGLFSSLKLGVNRQTFVIGVVLVVLVAAAVLLNKAGTRITGANVIGQVGKGITREEAMNQQRNAAAKRDINVLRTALEMFKRDCGRYPTTEEGLTALINNPGTMRWDGYYIMVLYSDPWSRKYIYRFTNETVTLLSCGRDKVEGTGDDILPDDTATNLFSTVATNAVP